MDALEIKIRFDIEEVSGGLQRAKQAFDDAITIGVRKAAQQLLSDARPYIPMLTGRLRDSGHLVELEDYAFKLVWDAANPRNGYMYAQKQYERVLQHVDGRYAARWIERVLQTNPGRYSFLAARNIEMELQKFLGS